MIERGPARRIAAAALGTTLLSGPLHDGGRPAGTAPGIAIAVALGGLAGTLAAAAYLLGARRRMSFDTEMHRLVDACSAAGLLADAAAFHVVMIRLLGRAHDRNAEEIGLLERAFTWMLWSILVMLCGLALTTIVG